MTAAQFKKWLKKMEESTPITNSSIAHALGVSVNSVMNYKLRGCDKRTALACVAVLMGYDVKDAYR